jgi:hypothetical protein
MSLAHSLRYSRCPAQVTGARAATDMAATRDQRHGTHYDGQWVVAETAGRERVNWSLGRLAPRSSVSVSGALVRRGEAKLLASNSRGCYSRRCGRATLAIFQSGLGMLLTQSLACSTASEGKVQIGCASSRGKHAPSVHPTYFKTSFHGGASRLLRRRLAMPQQRRVYDLSTNQPLAYRPRSGETIASPGRIFTKNRKIPRSRVASSHQTRPPRSKASPPRCLLLLDPQRPSAHFTRSSTERRKDLQRFSCKFVMHPGRDHLTRSGTCAEGH